MNWQFLLKLLALMQIYKLSENSHVQLPKQLTKTDVNASIGHLLSSITTAPVTNSSSTHPFYQRQRHFVHKKQNFHFAQIPQSPQTPQYNNSWQQSDQRIQRRHYHLDHHHSHNSRWVPRRHHRHHYNHRLNPQFTAWTAWTTCSPECVQRRERYCKTKRKCGHIKHIEERKCCRCHPAWPTKSSSLPPHEVEKQHQQQSISSALPTIVINAAAAAATAPISATSVVTQPESHHQHHPHKQQQPTPEVVLPTELNKIHHPVTLDSQEDKDAYQSTTHFKDDTRNHYRPNDHSGETDFYIIKTKRKRKHQQQHLSHHHHKRKPQLNELEDYVDYDEVFGSGSDGAADGLMSKQQQHEQLSKSTVFLTPSKTETKNRNPSTTQNYRKRSESKASWRWGIHKQKFNKTKRKFKGALRVADDNGAVEGDVFQYEDFDIDLTRSDGDGTGEEDLSYEDQPESDNGNFSNLTPPKERSTPDHLIPKHRRIYSKWSRWTKCSPKCTTRRYKKCRVREQCGREVLREIAYCYTEGSFCQQWLQAQVQKSPSYDLRPVATRRRDINDDGGTLSNAIGGTFSDFIMNGKGYRGPEYTPLKLKCGIAPIRSNKRNMYNMLKIIGGKASRKGEWPWQVAIFNRYKEAFCGGTLIAPQWVLTAAHCVRKVLYVRIGEHNLDYEDGTELQVKVLKSFKHPNFDKKTVDSDVALLKLPKPINSTTWIGFSCLPRPYQPLPKNMDCTVIGWGKRRNRDVAGTSVLHQAEVPIIPMDNCRSVYHDYTITKNMFCAGHKRGRIDTCAGDSGGPLLCRDTTKPNHPWTIFGITSFGDGCAKRNKFGIYAKVPNYVDWVWSVINCNGNCKMQQRSV